MWIGSLATLILLSILPFSSQQGTLFVVLRQQEFSATIWTMLQDIPVLGLLVLIVLLNGILAFFRGNDRKNIVLLLGVNLLAVVLFVIQFVFIRPDIPLGAGGFILFFTLLVYVAQGISRQGFIMGDSFISGSILSISVLLVVFILFPLFVVLGRSVFVDGRFAPANLFSTLQAYPSTWRILKNSLLMASSVGVLSTAIGLAFALVIERSRFRYKRFMQGFSLLPIITPPFVIGLAIIFMLGRTGYVTHGLFKMRSSFIFGFPGIVLAQTLSFAPMAYLILAGVVRSLDATLEEASYTMGANRWYTFKRVIWPLIRPGVANAFLISVIESLADFANPILLGGDFDVLSTSIYLAIIGATMRCWRRV